MTEFTMEQVAAHATPEDSWIAIDGKVYDVTKFAKVHPGGAGILRLYAGKDATTEFFAMHRSDILVKTGAKLVKGTIKGAVVGDLEATADKKNIDVAPYSESSHWLGWNSPYYKESHQRFRLKTRAFMEDVIRPEAEENEDDGTHPTIEVFQEMGKCGYLACRVGKDLMPHIEKMAGIDLEGGLGLKPSEFDHFHELIAHEEMGRISFPSFCDALGAGFCIGLPPVLHFAPPPIRDRVLQEVLSGNKRICLAISEPAAGSDVAGMLTTATKTPDGKHYIVNGIKKWITNGCFADYFVTAVRTGTGKGQKALSMLFISRDMGVETKAIKTTYSSCAGTALVIFDNVKVPVENLMGLNNTGKEGGGFACIMYNFNHERWFICAQFLMACRVIISDCFKWATTRMAFGKPLIQQPVLRHKLARMAGVVESTHSLLELVTYQMDTMPYMEQTMKLGGPIALLKYQTTRAGTLVADEGVQMFGGRGITRTGLGANIERFQKTFKYASILGGSEEVMADLAIRQQMLNGAVMQAKL